MKKRTPLGARLIDTVCLELTWDWLQEPEPEPEQEPEPVLPVPRLQALQVPRPACHPA